LLLFLIYKLFVLSHFLFPAEDEEDTIAAQEKVEGTVNHAEELDDLAKEGRFLSLIFLCICLGFKSCFYYF